MTILSGFTTLAGLNLLADAGGGGFFELLNRFQPVVMLVLTAAYVISSLVLVQIARRANALSARAVDETRRRRTAENRPYVTFDVAKDIRDNAYYILRNSGVTAALDVRVSLNEPQQYYASFSELNEAKPEDRKPLKVVMATQPIPIIAPDSDFSEFLTPFGLLYGASDGKRITGSIAYRAVDGNTYTTTIDVNLTPIYRRHVWADTGGVGVTEQDRLAETIHREVPRLQRAIEGFLKKHHNA